MNFESIHCFKTIISVFREPLYASSMAEIVNNQDKELKQSLKLTPCEVIVLCEITAHTHNYKTLLLVHNQSIKDNLRICIYRS